MYVCRWMFSRLVILNVFEVKDTMTSGMWNLQRDEKVFAPHRFDFLSFFYSQDGNTSLLVTCVDFNAL